MHCHRNLNYVIKYCRIKALYISLGFYSPVLYNYTNTVLNIPCENCDIYTTCYIWFDVIVMKGFLLQVAFNLFPSMTYIYFLYIQLCHSRSAVFATLFIQHYIKYSCFAFGNHFVLITNTFVSQIHNIILQCLFKYKKTLRCNSLIL